MNPFNSNPIIWQNIAGNYIVLVA